MGVYRSVLSWSIIVFNLLQLLIGGTIITLGGVYIIKYSVLNQGVPDSYKYFTFLPILAIVFGSILVLITIFGFGAVAKGSSYLLTAHSIILVVLFILQIALAIFDFLVIRNEVDLEKSINENIDLKFRQPDSNTKFIDFIQEKLHCCGTFGPKFWHEIWWSNDGRIPRSCYEDFDYKSMLYQSGCQDVFVQLMNSVATMTGVTILTLLTLQVIGAILVLSLANSIRNHKRRYRY